MIGARIRTPATLVLAASFVGHGGNYLFYLVAARMVAPSEFAVVSALIAFGTIAMMPLNGMQSAVARDVAVLLASGGEAELSAYLRRVLTRTAWTSIGIAVLLGGLSPVVANWLNLGSQVLVVLAGVWLAGMAILLVLTGVAQGAERFPLVAFALGGPLGALRPLFLPLCIVAAGVAGGMWAMLAATAVGIVVLARPVLRLAKVRPANAPRVASTPVTMATLLLFSSLTNADQLVSQAALPVADRGVYAGAVLLGKVALFAPSALAMVLLPRASAAIERGERADAAVLKTIGVTALCGLAVTGALCAIPASMLAATFGPAYVGSKPYLAPLALVMTAAAVLWVHVTFAIARRSRAMAFGLALAAACHWSLLGLFHASPGQVIAASATVIGATLIGVELFSSGGVARMLVRGRAS
ncbi:hypothetical protein LWC35_02475 [Pseudonocardia kujensis]|uniref:lipopolysaccharide biosynthesis protein n=1 Tax=Pseudonocardia kujensis TaxID=1128675 RepID=UPI001E2AB71E|nr:hypothetical protein [Pseudonocardia kujensis]MCE0761785.1 hypothetical protein [Pseudonocardia kujensis]